MIAKSRSAKKDTVRSNFDFWLIAIGGAFIGVFATAVVWLDTPVTQSNADVVVYKTAHCGCCTDWINQLKDSGLDISVINVRNTQAIHSQLGVPNTASSCHTATVGDYWVEGHVPVDLVQYLIEEKPSGIKGLAVPGMVVGSPGMEGPNPADYDVIAFDDDGESYIYESRKGKGYPQ